jgi:hypothetical protein
MGYGSRQPTSNDPPRSRPQGNPWIEETEVMDSIALLLAHMAARCTGCKRPVRNKYLKDNKCPDCRPGDPRPQPRQTRYGFGTPEGHCYDGTDAD